MNDFNQTDVNFVRNMIKHHEDALNMAAHAYNNGKNTWVKNLAIKIYEAQKKEIETMKNWLKANGQSASGGMSGMR